MTRLKGNNPSKKEEKVNDENDPEMMNKHDYKMTRSVDLYNKSTKLK